MNSIIASGVALVTAASANSGAEIQFTIAPSLTCNGMSECSLCYENGLLDIYSGFTIDTCLADPTPLPVVTVFSHPGDTGLQVDLAEHLQLMDHTSEHEPVTAVTFQSDCAATVHGYACVSVEVAEGVSFEVHANKISLIAGLVWPLYTIFILGSILHIYC